MRDAKSPTDSSRARNVKSPCCLYLQHHAHTCKAKHVRLTAEGKHPSVFMRLFCPPHPPPSPATRPSACAHSGRRGTRGPQNKARKREGGGFPRHSPPPGCWSSYLVALRVQGACSASHAHCSSRCMAGRRLSAAKRTAGREGISASSTRTYGQGGGGRSDEGNGGAGAVARWRGGMWRASKLSYGRRSSRYREELSCEKNRKMRFRIEEMTLRRRCRPLAGRWSRALPPYFQR